MMGSYFWDFALERDVLIAVSDTLSLMGCLRTDTRLS
jgi:hypothetical protein